MQKVYKGFEIPNFSDILIYMQEENDPTLEGKVYYDVKGINVVICTREEADKIKEEDGRKGLDKLISDTLCDFIDNTLDNALVSIGTVSEMEQSVKGDPTKVFKKMYGSQNVIKGDDGNEQISEKTQDSKEADKEESCKESAEEVDKPKDDEDELRDGRTSGGNRVGEDGLLEKNVELTPPDDLIKASDAGNWNKEGQLTDEEVDKIVDFSEKINEKNKEIQTIKNLPSNNGVTERDPSTITEKGELKMMKVSIDPNTGEHKILGSADDSELETETFEEMYERISNSEIDMETQVSKPISKEEAEDISKQDTSSLLGILGDNTDDVDVETIQKLITVANRKINGETFSAYNVMPEKIKELIDKYALESGISALDKRYNSMKHSVADMLLDDFIANININRIQHDFNSEIENLFDKASEEIGTQIVGYSEEKIAKYKEAALKMEDPVKKEKLLNVLKRIQDAYDLVELKEFAKGCKIKKFDLEKPGKYFDRYTSKYKDSNYNIYSIYSARPILFRNLNGRDDSDTTEYTDKDINAFFIAFCKQTTNMRAEDVLDHAYMYYLMYNIVLADLNKGRETKHISDTFLNNVKEVIKNLRERNKGVI